MATKNIVPRATGEGSLGTSEKKWGNIYADNITLVDGETLDTKISSIKDTADTAYTTATEIADDKLSLAGGTMTGTLYFHDGNSYISPITNSTGNSLGIGWQWTDSLGANCYFRSADYLGEEGQFGITARKSGYSVSLLGKPDGTLTWDGNNVATQNWVTSQGYQTSSTTYSAGSGLSLSGTTFNHDSTVTAGTAGTKSATSGATLAVPYVTTNATGHITAYGTHTHTISGFAASSHTHTYAGSSDVGGMCNQGLLVATCTTSASTAAKVATCSGFTLRTGACIILYHTKRIYAGNTLGVNNTGAKTIMISGATVSTYYSPAGSYLSICYYNGTNWILEGMNYGSTSGSAE